MKPDSAHKHDNASGVKTAFFLNLGFTVFEIIGGLWTNSLAIISDALHDLGDSFSLGLTWRLEKLAEKGRTKRYSYGYRRFSLLGAVTNAVVLIGGSLFVLSEAIPRLVQPEHSNAPGMALFALVGVAVNGVAALRLKHGQKLSAQVVAWHLLEDVLGWIAILIVSVTLLFTDIHILDPILSILITLYVLYNAMRNLRKASALFLQAIPEEIDVDEIEQNLLAHEKVRSTHHTHIWSLDGEHHVLTTHVVMDPGATREDVLQVKDSIKALAGKVNLEHITVEIEYGDEVCEMAEDNGPLKPDMHGATW